MKRNWLFGFMLTDLRIYAPTQRARFVRPTHDGQTLCQTSKKLKCSKMKSSGPSHGQHDTISKTTNLKLFEKLEE